MATKIFENKTTDGMSDVFKANGLLQVDVSGELGGADLITYIVEDNGALAPQACCSWRTSLGETIPEGADTGAQEMNNRNICFAVVNAGVGTNVSLYFDAQ